MAVSSCVITVEGILRKYVTEATIPTGICLYHGLANTFNVLLATDLEKAELDRWCSIEGLTRHAAVEYNEGTVSFMDPDFRRRFQVNSLRNRGYSIDLVIEPSPVIVTKLLMEGYTTMLFTHADYSLPQWRPDYEHKVRPWEEIETYENKMAELRALDLRLSDKENSSGT